MKITAGSAESFIRRPDPAVRAVLVYGPDEGLVRERADRLVAGAVESPDDPFLVAELPADSIADDPARLFDEASAMALTGGRRAVRIRDAGSGTAAALTKALGGFLADPPPGDTLVVVQAGNLGPRIALRKAFEDSATAAALPCYADDAGALDRLIEEVLGADNIRIAPDARAFLAANLGSDRGVTRAELEKLAIYAGSGGEIGIGDVEACIGDNALRSLDAIVQAAGDGDRSGLDRELAASLAEGANPVMILRAMARHLLRLHWIAARLEAGERGRRAAQGLQPPVFPMHVERIVAQAGRWRGRALGRALELVMDAERQCKRTGTPAEAVCGRTLLQVAALGRRRA